MTLWRKETGEPFREPQFVVEVVTDPIVIAELREVSEQFQQNSDWLQRHWADLLPQAFGKHLVVAGQEAFLADSATEAIAKARTAHPEDKGLLARYVSPHRGPKIYAVRR
jgi:hypothetical protein